MWFLGSNALQNMIVTFDASMIEEGRSDHLYVGLSKYGAGNMLTDEYFLAQENDSFDIMTHPMEAFKAANAARRRQQR